MADASPPKWHLAHTTWFFETFVLRPFADTYRVFDDAYEYLFNSYYNGVGQPFPRPLRGTLSRPTVETVYRYRQHVNEHIEQLLMSPGKNLEEIVRRIELGCHHEQQHQELLITDLKYNFGKNPLYPSYVETGASSPEVELSDTLSTFDGGVVEIGHADNTLFGFDNEYPRHEVLLRPFRLANRLTTNGDYLQFIEEGGYQRSELWLSDGWAWLQEKGIRAPEYWIQRDHSWYEYRLDGLHPLDPALPVTHVSAYEAFAYVSWLGGRLPTEFEMEWAAHSKDLLRHAGESGFQDSGAFHPQAVQPDFALADMFGQTWQWTSSSYGPYPGYQPLPGTLGEYNGKFMSSQLVLRGASCATPKQHSRTSYRNFFYPPDRWQFTGIRVARDV